MNIFFKYVSVAFVAASLIGCGDDCSKDKTGLNEAALENKSVKRVSPKVVNDAQIVLLYRDNKSPALESILTLVKERFKKEMAKQDDVKEFERFLEKSGLEDSEIKWILLSMGEVDFSTFEENPDLSSLAVVLAVEHDSYKILDLLLEEAKSDDSAKYESMEVSKVKVIKIVSTEKDTLNEAFFVTAINDSFLIFSGSEEMLKRQIALYRDNAPGDRRFNGIIEDDDIVVGMSIGNFGKILESAIKEDPEGSAEAEAFLSQINYKNIKVLDLGLKSDMSGEVSAAIEVETATADDAVKLVSIARTFMMVFNAMLTQQVQNQSDPDAETALEVLNSVQIKSEGPRAKFTLPIPDKAVKLFIKEFEKGLKEGSQTIEK